MKVLIVGSGRSYHATRWANSLAQHGIEVGLATVHKVERPLVEKVKLFSLSKRGTRGYLLEAPKLRALLGCWRPDIVHAHYATGYGLMSKLVGFSPRIVSIYGSDIYEFPHRSTLHKWLLGYALSRAKVLTTSEAMRDEFVRNYPRCARPQVTPFGVDVSLFRPKTEGRVLQSNQCHIGIVKKLEHVYGLDVLLRAFAQLRRLVQGMDIHLHIVGRGSQEGALRVLADQLGLGGFVIFHSAIPNQEVPEFLQHMDIFVVPSRSESFGVAAVEAQACELPVVASAVGGLPEVIADRHTGIIVPPDDPGALAAALAELCSNPGLRVSYGQAGRRRVEQLYDWSRNVEKMIGIYRDTLGK